jgi:Glycosyl transferase family 2
MPVPADDLGHPLDEFFDRIHEHRGRRYASYDPARPNGRRSAVVTMVHDESVFLPIWLGYYSRFFAPEDIHVLDNDTTDGSTDGGGFVRVPVAHDMFDDTWRVRTVEDYQHDLVERYDAVLVTDVDEIVVPDPEWGTLGEYLDRFDEPWVNCLGYELLHMRDREPAFDPARPVLEQRGYWYANDDYDKPALATEPMHWKPGFHRRADDEFTLDPDLRLIHLHRMDYEVCLERHRRLRARQWNREDVALGRGSHIWNVDDAEFERWFYEESSDKNLGIALERIPDSWRGAF